MVLLQLGNHLSLLLKYKHHLIQKEIATPQGPEPSTFVDASGRKQLKEDTKFPFGSLRNNSFWMQTQKHPAGKAGCKGTTAR